jgi:hypothetical protein
MASGDKRNRPGTTGAFGVGFTAVYQFTDRPELLSNGEHWFVDEMASEHERIKRARAPAGHEGTTFRLPWALEKSPFREAVRQEPVSRSVVASFREELISAVPLAMPFLKKLRRIEVWGSAGSRSFDRAHGGGRVSVRSDDGACLEWLLVDGDFSIGAAELKSAAEERARWRHRRDPIGRCHRRGPSQQR